MRLPANPLDRVIDAASAGTDTVARIAHLLPRVAGILDSAEELLARAVDLLSRFDESEIRLRLVISQVAASDEAAREVINAVALLQARSERLLDRYEPIVSNAADTLAYTADRFGPAQVDEVMTTMSTFKTVAPDLTELLAASKALNEMMGSVPGLGRAKKRIDNELAQDDDGQTGSSG